MIGWEMRARILSVPSGLVVSSSYARIENCYSSSLELYFWIG